MFTVVIYSSSLVKSNKITFLRLVTRVATKDAKFILKMFFILAYLDCIILTLTARIVLLGLKSSPSCRIAKTMKFLIIFFQSQFYAECLKFYYSNTLVFY